MNFLKLIEYTVRPEQKELVLDEINLFLDQVRLHEPEINYRVFVKEGGVSFIHLLGYDSVEMGERHYRADYTQNFWNNVKRMCVKSPVENFISEV